MQILEKLGPCPIFGWAFSVVSFCRLSILQASGRGDEEQRDTSHTLVRPGWGGRRDRWGDQKIISGACASPKQSSTIPGCHFLTEWSVKASVCFNKVLIGSSNSAFPTAESGWASQRHAIFITFANRLLWVKMSRVWTSLNKTFIAFQVQNHKFLQGEAFQKCPNCPEFVERDRGSSVMQLVGDYKGVPPSGVAGINTFSSNSDNKSYAASFKHTGPLTLQPDAALVDEKFQNVTVR